MTISHRQFTLLTEMGIALWQYNKAKVKPTHQTVETKITKTSPTSKLLPFDLEQLNHQQVFKDILLSLNIANNKLLMEQHSLDLGLIKWQFIAGKSIEFNNNLLKTPSIELVAQSKQLKRQLWHILQQQKSS